MPASCARRSSVMAAQPGNIGEPVLAIRDHRADGGAVGDDLLESRTFSQIERHFAGNREKARCEPVFQVEGLVERDRPALDYVACQNLEDRIIIEDRVDLGAGPKHEGLPFAQREEAGDHVHVATCQKNRRDRCGAEAPIRMKGRGAANLFAQIR